MTFIIKTPAGYVTGFNGQHQRVQITNMDLRAKPFKTEKAACDWIRKYADAGYGLSMATACVETQN